MLIDLKVGVIFQKISQKWFSTQNVTKDVMFQMTQIPTKYVDYLWRN